MNKPLIGLTSLMDYDANEYRMQTAYMDFIEKSGGAAVILPLTEDRSIIRTVISSLGGILFTGGPDIAPSYFGEETSPYCGYISEVRDRNELAIFNEAIKTEIPIFGICRGIQLINVALGGTLYQDIPTEVECSLDHSMSEKFRDNSHYVDIETESPLYAAVGASRIEVNSYHHQAIKNAAPDLRASAVSEDGIVEGVYLPGNRFIQGVQWHPERTFGLDGFSDKIAEAFIFAARGYKSKKH